MELRMHVRWQVIVIDYHFWLTAALSLWRHFSPNALINSEAILWRACPASDSGKDSKLFEPCSQQTQRFCGKRRYEKNNWEQNTWVDFRRGINFHHTNIKQGPRNVSALITKVFLLGPFLLYLLLIDLLTYNYVYSFIHSSIQSTGDANQLTAIQLNVQHFYWSRTTQYPLAATA